MLRIRNVVLLRGEKFVACYDFSLSHNFVACFYISSYRIMVVAFSVSPRRSAAPNYTSLFHRYGTLAYFQTDLSGWEDDFRMYKVFMHPVTVDPFHPSIVDARGDSRVEVIDDHLFGRDCRMGKKEWRRFCREVLMLDAAVPQTMDAVVGVVDEMLVTIVRSIAGCDSFAMAPGARMMVLVMAMVRFLLLCGGVGVFPQEYALARFGAASSYEKCKSSVDVSVHAFAQKVVRRLTSLGRCVRGLIRVAWEHSAWEDPELVAKFGLEAGKTYYLCDVWRAVVGGESGLAVLMRSVIGPSYNVYGPYDAEVGYVNHEYDRTSWGSGTVHNPMSSDTLVANSALAVVVSAGGRMTSFGGIDRQVKLFLHNIIMGFGHESRFRALGGKSPVVVDFLDLMGVSFGAGFDGKGLSGQFRFRGGRSWFIGGRDGLTQFGEEEEEAVVSFLSALDGSRVVEVDSDAAFRESMMADARRIVTNFVRIRGYGDDVMDVVASVSCDDLVS